MQLALFEAGQGPTPNANGSGRSLKRTSARRRWPAQHEVRRKDVGEVLSDPRLSFRLVDDGPPAPALLRSGRCPVSRPGPTPPTDPVPDLGTPATGVGTSAPAPALEDNPKLHNSSRSSTLEPHPTRGKTLVPEVLTEGEVRALIGACSKRAVTGIRNKALLAVLWRTGIRISEALDLMPHDVDYERGTVRVRLGKGLKPRTTVLNNLDCVPFLQDWLRLREQLAGAGEGASLFCTLAATRTATSYIRHLMPRLARRVGIERRVHAHALRHTHAADLAIAGVPELAIQRQLGHASLSTTSEYLKRVGVRLDMLRMVRGAPTAARTLLAPTPRRHPGPAAYW